MKKIYLYVILISILCNIGFAKEIIFERCYNLKAGSFNSEKFKIFNFIIEPKINGRFDRIVQFQEKYIEEKNAEWKNSGKDNRINNKKHTTPGVITKLNRNSATGEVVLEAYKGSQIELEKKLIKNIMGSSVQIQCQ
tara:strand:+ start:434 stop:844 length:411 start_codon:yes stop_codon:yes gene_type:complete